LGITETIIDYALLKAKTTVREHARNTLVTLIKLLPPGFVAVSLVGFGIFFVLIGIVVYLSELMISALAWEVVGLTTVAVGLFILWIIRR